MWLRKNPLKSGFGDYNLALGLRLIIPPSLHVTKNRECTQGSLAKCDKILALLMANQVPNCPPTARLLIKYVRESSLELKPNENFLFSFQNKTHGESWVSTNRLQWYKASLRKELQASHMVTGEWERKTAEMASLLQGIYLKGTENIGGKLTPHSSERARARARHRQWSAQCTHTPVKE